MKNSKYKLRIKSKESEAGGSATRGSECCSGRREFDSQPSSQETHKLTKLQCQGTQCPLLPSIGMVLTKTNTHVTRNENII